jgi:hypothetical protein
MSKVRLSQAVVAIVAAVLSVGCSLAVEGKARASFLAPMNREVKQSADSAIAEGQIVGALIVEAGGEPFLAEAYLKARGYSDNQVAERIALARARGAAQVGRKQ